MTFDKFSTDNENLGIIVGVSSFLVSVVVIFSTLFLLEDEDTFSRRLEFFQRPFTQSAVPLVICFAIMVFAKEGISKCKDFVISTFRKKKTRRNSYLDIRRDTITKETTNFTGR